MDSIYQGFSLLRNHGEVLLDVGTSVRYLYEAGELESGRKKATDPNWSVDVYKIVKRSISVNQPMLYYLDGVKRYFVRKELLVV